MADFGAFAILPAGRASGFAFSFAFSLGFAFCFALSFGFGFGFDLVFVFAFTFGLGFAAWRDLVLPVRDFPAAARAGRDGAFLRAERVDDVRFECVAKAWCSKRKF